MRKETLLAPVSGIVAQIVASNGSLVKENELILQIEVCKMYIDCTAGLDGKLELIINLGEFVTESQELGTITEV